MSGTEICMDEKHGHEERDKSNTSEVLKSNSGEGLRKWIGQKWWKLNGFKESK